MRLIRIMYDIYFIFKIFFSCSFGSHLLRSRVLRRCARLHRDVRLFMQMYNITHDHSGSTITEGKGLGRRGGKKNSVGEKQGAGRIDR